MGGRAHRKALLMSGTPRHLARLALVGGAALLIAAGCSSSNDTPSATSSPATSAPQGTGSTTLSNTDPDARLAQAKTVAVGFFEAQAVNDWEKAMGRSSGAAQLTVKWAQAVNTIAAANGTPYQVKSVTAPNVRVQLDELTPSDDGRWAAKGFIELSFRPGPVASTTSSTTANPTNTNVAAGGTAGAFVVDLIFSGDGDALKLDDYRLDDTPYPVSQLFMAVTTPQQDASGVSGQVTLGHRDLDGSVQYLIAAKNDGGTPASVTASTFVPGPVSPTGTGAPTTRADAGPPSKGTVFSDPVESSDGQPVLVVFGGAFPGSAGTLTLSVAAAASPATSAPSTPGTAPRTELSWTVPDWPALTARPVNTVTTSTTTTSTSTTSTSTTSTTVPGSTTTVIVPAPPTVTVPPTQTTRGPTTTTTSTTTTTTPR